MFSKSFDFQIYSIFFAFFPLKRFRLDFFFFCARESILVYFWCLRCFILFSSLFPPKSDFVWLLLLCGESVFVNVGCLCACLCFDLDISFIFALSPEAISSGSSSFVLEKAFWSIFGVCVVSFYFLRFFPLIIEKVGHWSIFSRPKNGSTSLQNSLFEHCSKSRSASKRRKTAQLRSKIAFSTQHNSVFVVTSRSLRGHFAVTSRLQRGHYAVTTALRGHYAVTTVTTRSPRSLRSQKEHIFETETTLNFVPK